MKCVACAGLIPADASFCPHCGTDIRSTEPGPTDAREHTVALAAANLLRLRRKWSEAEARCIEVLRADPNDLHAHSLLGDIYADQGRLEDARQWYQLALDLDPKSRADREKLARLRGEVEPSPADGAVAPEARVLGVETGLAARWVGLILLVFLLGAAGAWISQGTRGPRANAPSPSASVSRTRPLGAQLDAGIGGATSMRRPVSQAVSDPAADASAETEEEATGILERESLAEQRIKAGVALNERTVVAALVLVGNGRTAVLVLGRQTPMDGAPRDRGEIILDALTACQSVVHADPQIATVDVTVRAPSGEPLFRGRAGRAGLLSQSSSTTPDQAVGAFTMVWWAPDAA